MKAFAPILLFAVASSASATTMTLQGLALPSTDTLDLNYVGGINSQVYAGPENASLDGGPTFRVFCADLAHLSNGTPTAVTLVDTSMATPGWQKAAKLLNKYFVAVGNDKDQNAALQLAIWRAVFAGPNLTTSNYSPASIDALADSYLNSDLTGYSSHAIYYDFGGANQSMIGVDPVPEPAPLAALGLGALALLRRRRRA